MGTLLRYELKKILTRKAVWLALALCAAVQLLNCYGDIRLALGGAVGGGGDSWWMNSPFWRAINDFTARLPAILLTNRYMTVSSASTLKFMPYTFGMPALITALCLLLAPRQFLKRRKA
jgi:hypothetical protein